LASNAKTIRLTDANISISLDIWNQKAPFSPLQRSLNRRGSMCFACWRNMNRRGLAAGDIAKALSVPQNTMSSHLSILSRAGLVTAQRFSRSIVYRADLTRFQAVVLFMLKDCCDGRPEICAPVVKNLAPCCPPLKAEQPKKRRTHVRV
jgi:ArsR family transcriptional regulator